MKFIYKITRDPNIFPRVKWMYNIPDLRSEEWSIYQRRYGVVLVEKLEVPDMGRLPGLSIMLNAIESAPAVIVFEA